MLAHLKKNCLYWFLIRNTCQMNLFRTIPREPQKYATIMSLSPEYDLVWGLTGHSTDSHSGHTSSQKVIALFCCPFQHKYILSIYWSLHPTKGMKTEDSVWVARGLPPLEEKRAR